MYDCLLLALLMLIVAMQPQVRRRRSSTPPPLAGIAGGHMPAAFPLRQSHSQSLCDGPCEPSTQAASGVFTALLHSSLQPEQHVPTTDSGGQPSLRPEASGAASRPGTVVYAEQWCETSHAVLHADPATTDHASAASAHQMQPYQPLTRAISGQGKGQFVQEPLGQGHFQTGQLHTAAHAATVAHSDLPAATSGNSSQAWQIEASADNPKNCQCMTGLRPSMQLYSDCLRVLCSLTPTVYSCGLRRLHACHANLLQVWCQWGCIVSLISFQLLQACVKLFVVMLLSERSFQSP